jgi:hypothetical protein
MAIQDGVESHPNQKNTRVLAQLGGQTSSEWKTGLAPELIILEVRAGGASPPNAKAILLAWYQMHKELKTVVERSKRLVQSGDASQSRPRTRIQPGDCRVTGFRRLWYYYLCYVHYSYSSTTRRLEARRVDAKHVATQTTVGKGIA